MSPTSRSQASLTLVLALICVQATGVSCFTRKPPAAEPMASTPEPQAPPPMPPPEPLPDPRVGDLESRNRRLELTILERESEIQDLGKRLTSQQRMLDDAIQEVVRAKAKLRTLESRAEAASQMAETEIAYKALKGRSGEGGPPEMLQIDQMMSQSAAEFEKENFGGALYLSSQAKALIQNAQLILSAMADVPAGSGEVPFSSPIILKLTKRSNVRGEPGLEAPVIITLDEGSLVTGYSYKSDWIRVKTTDGSYGWIHQALLTGR